MRAIRFLIGVLLLLIPEILRVYFIMPFPGSQEDVPTDTSQVDIAYFLHHNIWWIRLLGLALIIGPLVHYLRTGGWGKRVGVLVPVALGTFVIYAFNFKFMADKMFYPPKTKRMAAPVVTDSTENSLVVVVEHNGDARAYPIELIGYHHQILDTIGGAPTLITYCTVCRTGRVFSPVVNGRQETFRLVGMDHFNAMFEDRRTQSWWRQVSGECIVGPLEGQQLAEVFSRQMTLGEFAWLHPLGLVFQPDSNFMEQYAGLGGFDDGTIDSGLEYRDTASWKMKSWVVGVLHKGRARAYDWNDLVRHSTLWDTLAGDSVVVEASGASFRASLASARSMAADHPVISDGRDWDDFPMGPVHRTPIPAYQEFWHSWRTFHPNTTRYEQR